MIYGVNRPVSIYFSHGCKSVSQPRPYGIPQGHSLPASFVSVACFGLEIKIRLVAL